jgi:hypothetical protein
MFSRLYNGNTKDLSISILFPRRILIMSEVGNAKNVANFETLISFDYLFAQAKSIINKIQGKRATPKATPDPAIPVADQPKTVSSSQMSYDQRVESLDRLIKVLEEQIGYAPNETELKTATLNTNLTDMRAKNTAVVNSGVELSNSRLSRNDLLYADEKGLVKTDQDVKKIRKIRIRCHQPAIQTNQRSEIYNTKKLELKARVTPSGVSSELELRLQAFARFIT